MLRDRNTTAFLLHGEHRRQALPSYRVPPRPPVSPISALTPVNFRQNKSVASRFCRMANGISRDTTRVDLQYRVAARNFPQRRTACPQTTQISQIRKNPASLFFSKSASICENLWIKHFGDSMNSTVVLMRAAHIP